MIGRTAGRKITKAFLGRLTRKIQFLVFDFDGVFTDNRVVVLQDGSEGVFCSRADGLGLEALRRSGIQTLVLSKEKNPVVTARCKKLQIDCLQGCDEKPQALQREAERRGVALDRVGYLGNDVNDLGCLQVVGFPACVADAHPAVMAVSYYVTRTPGGYGAVREFCDLIMELRV